MELALPLSCYLLWLFRFGTVGGSLLRSSLVTLQNESQVEQNGTCKGVVLIHTNQAQSLVCDDHWDVDSPLAQVVCQESGCGTPNTTWILESAPRDLLSAIEGIICTGNESRVSECESPGQAVQRCDLQRIAAVSCNQDAKGNSGNHSIRLSRGRTPCDGHVEVLEDNKWSPVCFTGVNESSAELLCQQMGCKPQRPVFTSILKGRLSLGAVSLQCQGNETYMWDCEPHVLNVCINGPTTYLQCNRSRMEESWLVWTTICFAALMIVVFCCARITKSQKCCGHTLHKCSVPGLSRKSRTRQHRHWEPEPRRSIYHREPPDVIVEETNSLPPTPRVLQNPNGKQRGEHL
ncbi:scavenger receptor cysteine-rich type 1 protein M130 isoform X2 [Bombina bombina]|uniref:scavenger receptor cysteine-rich type 1 protein M130 isoform X2 n=1 Tax=Bombina bombina TaxID=8345 RepID=UPI00235AE581|nr:scavenger receptor cysteine-rich type 1 protein M130 isoform X2 [Bombina bombina]